MKNQIGVFILRVVLGVTFLVHGLVKFQTIDGISGWFQSIGLPSFMAYGVTGIEILGGIGLIIGLGTRIISVIISALMIGATIKVKLAVGFLGNGQLAGWELDLALLAIAIYLAISGSYALSLDGFIKRDNKYYSHDKS
ncbi:DoxX family protein [Paenibacillus cremeus]|uniref:DoxX family protein n=1 Tax=Paenibacillus cremeus TaxID=2163881 RepID=A0A559JG19_9BACL|nr:DoxX family protein [Paenibacillus cremeus]TVX98822.1 DoxX family protein [Paenibacillus cremeus]